MWVVIKLLTIVTNVSFKTAPIESRKTSREQGGTLYRDSLTRSQCALQVSLTLSSKQNTPITFKREKRSKPRSKINVNKRKTIPLLECYMFRVLDLDERVIGAI